MSPTKQKELLDRLIADLDCYIAEQRSLHLTLLRSEDRLDAQKRKEPAERVLAVA